MESRASEPLSIHASGFGPLFPCNNREALLSPEEQPPHRNQNVSPILIKKRPDPFLLDQAVFFFFLYGNEAAEVLPSSPHFSPQHSGRLNRRRNSCRTASPPVESLRKGGGRGRNNPSSEGVSSPGHLHYFFSGNGPRGRKRHVSRISIAASLMKGMSL